MAEHATYFPSWPTGLLDLLPFPAALLDKKGRFVYRNEAHQRHPLWRNGGMLKTPSHPSAGGKQEEDQFHEICAKVVQQEKAQFHLETVRDADNTARRYRWLCLPLLNGQGVVEHLLLVELDEENTLEGLSDRELEVFEHIGQGHATQDIAEAMGISPKTVESYRARIKEKLDLSHNTDLVRHAIRWMEGDATLTPPDKSIFLGELAQEIRSPLAAIAGLADSLAQRSDPEQARLAHLILTSTQQLIRHLDLKIQSAQRHVPRSNGHG